MSVESSRKGAPPRDCGIGIRDPGSTRSWMGDPRANPVLSHRNPTGLVPPHPTQADPPMRFWAPVAPRTSFASSDTSLRNVCDSAPHDAAPVAASRTGTGRPEEEAGVALPEAGVGLPADTQLDDIWPAKPPMPDSAWLGERGNDSYIGAPDRAVPRQQPTATSTSTSGAAKVAAAAASSSTVCSSAGCGAKVETQATPSSTQNAAIRMEDEWDRDGWERMGRRGRAQDEIQMAHRQTSPSVRAARARRRGRRRQAAA